MPRLRLLALLLCLSLSCRQAPVRAAEPFRFPEEKHGKGELKYINGVPVLKIEGTPEELGEQFGALSKKAAPGLTGYFKKLLKSHGLEPALPILVKTADAMFSRCPAEYRRELEAGAKASGIDRDLLVVGNTFWDISKLGGCSALLVDPGRSAAEAPLFGRNFDFPTLGLLHEYSLVVICRPKDKHAFAAVGFPGLIGCASGINDTGLALATLDVTSTHDGSPAFDLSGTPLILTFRRILEECTTVEEAGKVLRSVKRTTLMNLAVCDKKGGAVFEITPRNVIERRGTEGLCACTNHFRTKKLATWTKCRRYHTLESSQEMAKLSVGAVAKKLHAVNQGAMTIQTMVFEPAALRLHVALGKGPSSALPLQLLELRPLLRRSQELGVRN